MSTPTLVETPVLSLKQILEEMMSRKIAKVMSNKSSRQKSMVLEEDHFFLEVMAVPLPRDFKQPKMEKYNGSYDLVDHLRWEARDWIATLPPKSIRTFDDFSKSLDAHFASSKRVKKTDISLMQLTQDKDELLKDFIARFNRTTLGIKDL
ncbi:Uncharacterized protein Adt_36319 [Abeliophyllum distichum]|uniref:Retrotransposon gag domain-containing protein n=1 Tax=Abeliophyllum distichum TaxID=126358 RepID=A0ABD1QJ57_9LAMI